MARKKPTASDNNRTAQKRAAKKTAVLGGNQKSPLPIILLFAVVVLIGSLVYVYGFMENASTAEQLQAQPSTAGGGQMISIPADTFADGKVRHYEYKSSRHTIRYFVLKSSDGVIRAAFDACDVCWPAGKGYFQSGDNMICRNCGKRFASVLINEIRGGCNPAPLTRRMDNHNVVIQVAHILEGRRYFNFKDRV